MWLEMFIADYAIVSLCSTEDFNKSKQNVEIQIKLQIETQKNGKNKEKREIKFEIRPRCIENLRFSYENIKENPYGFN